MEMNGDPGAILLQNVTLPGLNTHETRSIRTDSQFRFLSRGYARD